MSGWQHVDTAEGRRSGVQRAYHRVSTQLNVSRAKGGWCWTVDRLTSGDWQRLARGHCPELWRAKKAAEYVARMPAFRRGSAA